MAKQVARSQQSTAYQECLQSWVFEKQLAYLNPFITLRLEIRITHFPI